MVNLGFCAAAAPEKVKAKISTKSNRFINLSKNRPQMMRVQQNTAPKNNCGILFDLHHLRSIHL
jgi:hypothetical protein